MITVAQLIAKLGKLPPDMPVVTTGDDGRFNQDPQFARREHVVFGGMGNSSHWHGKPEDPESIEVVWL